MAPPKRKRNIKFKLAVIKFTEQTSGEATARQFGMNPKQVRIVNSHFNFYFEVDQKRARLQGGGREKC